MNYPSFYRRSLDDREGFWREEAKLVDWETPFTQVLDYSRPPFAKWFVGGRTNLCPGPATRAQIGDAQQVLTRDECGRLVHGSWVQPA